MKDSLRIGIEAQRLFRPHKHGMDVYALELIRALQAIDQKNEYFIFVQPDEDDSCLKETPNFHIIRESSFSYPSWEQLALPKLAKKYKLDVLHCTANTAPVQTKVPLVLTLHDIIFLENISFSGSSYQNFGNLYRRLVVPRIVESCHTIITVSEFEKKRILNHLQIPAEKVKVTYNAISSKFSVNKDEKLLEDTRTKYKLPKEFIFFLGNTAPKKNTPGLIKAYAEYAGSAANPLPIVITDCKREYIHSLLEEQGKVHIMDKVVLPGYVPFTDIPLLYNLASLFVYPSLRESFGIPILEAMACGTPVISSNTTSMPEVSGDAALLIDPTKPSEIAAAMNKITSNKALANQMIADGLARASKFSWTNTAKETLKIYSSVKARKEALALSESM